MPWLPGYEGSAPVRVGNAAHGQLQLDVFGEVMDALHQARCHGIAASESGWDLQKAILSHLERVWVEPDEGIWEVRGGPKHFTYSKVMAWVSFDRAIRSADQFNLDGPVDRWREIAATIHADVCRRGYDPELGSFVQSYGAKQLDASLLLIPHVGFLPPDDARVRSTLEAIEKRLDEVEKVNARLESAALTTSRAMGEISQHWDAVYEAMRRRESGAISEDMKS